VLREDRLLAEDQRNALLSELRSLISFGSSYALVDFPDYSNVGDSAIWLGQLKLLKEVTGENPSYVSTWKNFRSSDLVSSCPDGPILIAGGGNFGDLWPWHQRLREKLWAEHRDRRIIQMPQSIFFNDYSNVSRCAASVESHGNFVLLVRDERSFEFASSSLSCSVRLIPDAALGLGPLTRPVLADRSVVLLLRTDSEQMDYDRSPLSELEDSWLGDWLDEPRRLSLRLSARERIKQAFKRCSGDFNMRSEVYRMLAEHRLARGIRILSHGRRVVTDRLHAHILSFLLGIPHVALDNNYGKLSGYVSSWHSGSASIATARSAREAIEKLKGLPSGV
jgi:exopolysaccharide biosynthesis predicted pyruvyltransferase EpsI